VPANPAWRCKAAGLKFRLLELLKQPKLSEHYCHLQLYFLNR